MTLLYLKDDYNNITAVVVPISDWKKITQAHQDINLMLSPKTDNNKKLKPSDYRGCISKETADKLNAHIVQSRNEWNNEI